MAMQDARGWKYEEKTCITRGIMEWNMVETKMRRNGEDLTA
jgi:hypothetical protein